MFITSSPSELDQTTAILQNLDSLAVVATQHCRGLALLAAIKEECLFPQEEFNSPVNQP